jgi:hypothetical protein
MPWSAATRNQEENYVSCHRQRIAFCDKDPLVLSKVKHEWDSSNLSLRHGRAAQNRVARDAGPANSLYGGTPAPNG